MKRQRNFKEEYARRIARGLARGLSRSQARGHPKPKETKASAKKPVSSYDPRLEQGLKSLRQGQSLSSSAKSISVSPKRLRRYVLNTGVVEKRGRRWVVRNDRRRRQIPLYSDGKLITVIVRGYEAAASIGRYMAAVKQFLATNDIEHLAPFVGEAVTDTARKVHLFETRPNVLHRLNAVGSESFEQIYRIM
jgi:hypothetical protein